MNNIKLASEVQKSGTKLSYVYQCSRCDSFWFNQIHKIITTKSIFNIFYFNLFFI